MGSTEELTGERVVSELTKCGVSHIVWVPDIGTSFIYPAMTGRFSLVPVCREGEAMPIAAGLVLGGKKPVVLHQSTGLFESGDSLRLVASELCLPVLMLIGYRGWKVNSPVTDSAALFIEPVLKAWGVRYYLLKSDEDIGLISLADKEAQELSQPVAVLIARERRP